MSFKDAAEELCVTPSAISHQVRVLEEFLATRLFVRKGNRLQLSVTGESYLGKLSGLLDALCESTQSVQAKERRELRILATPGFAARWLVPRMESLEFWRDIRLRVSVGAPDTDFSRNEADVVIHWGDQPVDGAVVEPFLDSGRYPVASRDFIRREGIESAKDLLRVTLFHDEVMDGWSEWFCRAGITPPANPLGPRFPHCEFSTTAAEAGKGVALAYDAVVRRTLERGSLVRLFRTISLPRTIYSLAYRRVRAGDPRIRAFRNWVFRQVADDKAKTHEQFASPGEAMASALRSPSAR